MLKVKCAYKRCNVMIEDTIENPGQRNCSPKCVAGAMGKIRDFNKLVKLHRGKSRKMIKVDKRREKDERERFS